ncbi:MAG: hypothetical protein HY721_09695 [Planctomycetes bacterium]|nr:hypothetical protein [Planctomycetota bacterium]
MTDDSHRFTPVADVLPGGEDPREPEVARRLLEEGYLTLHEGKTFHQFDDRWGDRPRYLVHLTALADKPAWREAARYYRLAFRNIARSTDERTAIFSLHPPGVAAGEKGPSERLPARRPVSRALMLEAVGNTFGFDYCLRARVAATVNLFILNACPVPPLSPAAEAFLAHAALRLTANHSGYAPLWRSELSGHWREPSPPGTWPVIPGDGARWQLRAAIDTAVAQAYGLDRAQYAHVLASFSHKSCPQAPDLCLAAFDELEALRLEAFARKHDPYWDVPLNEELPKPVIDLPAPVPAGPGAAAPEKPFVGRGGQLEMVPPDWGPLFETATKKPKPAADRTRPAPTADRAEESNGAFQRLLALLQERGTLASRDAQDATGLSAAAVRPHLERLVAEGHAVKEGERRGTRYRRVER